MRNLFGKTLGTAHDRSGCIEITNHDSREVTIPVRRGERHQARHAADKLRTRVDFTLQDLDYLRAQFSVRKRNVLSSSNASRILQILIDEGKVLAQDIARYLHIAELEDKLRALHGGEVPVHHRKARVTAANAGKRRKRVVSAARQASQAVQGQYLGYIRQVAKKERPKFQKIAKEQGREKAIAAMKKQLGK